jgi:hypothetical protein
VSGEPIVSCHIESLNEKIGGNRINKWVVKVPEMHPELIDNPLKFGYLESAKKYANLREQARYKLREAMSQGNKFEYQIEKIPQNFFCDHHGNGIVVRKIEYDMPVVDFFDVTSTKTVPLGMIEIAWCDTMELAQSIVYQWERGKKCGIC